MTRFTHIALTCLFAFGCALEAAPEPEFDDELGETGWEDPPVDPDDPGPSGPELDPVPADPAPGGRVLWVDHDGDDLVVGASIGGDVADAYGNADHYALRFDANREYVMVGLVDGEGALVESMRMTRVTDGPEGDLVELDFPVSAPPSAEGCDAAVCPWDASWPSDGSTHDHLRVVHGPEAISLRGSISGWVMSRDLVLDPDTQQLEVIDLESPPDTSRLVRVGVVLADLEALAPEVEPIEDCLWCSLGALWLVSKAGQCGAGIFDSCKKAYDGAMKYEDECSGACLP